MLGPLCLVTVLLQSTGASRVKTDVATGFQFDAQPTNCDLKRYSELYGRFDNIKYAGSGASGCVMIANDKHNAGAQVAIKVSKTAGHYDRWKTECDKTKRIHKLACQAGGLLMQLSERFLPNCLGMGGTQTEPYIIMQPVGIGEGLHDKVKMLNTVIPEERLSVFAQMIGALAAVHGVGWSHNDLSNGNVGYVQREPPTKIAFLDFGSSRTEDVAYYTGNYKQNETLIVRRAGELADCSDSDIPDRHYPVPIDMKEGLIACLRLRWASEGADDEFFRVFGDVYDETAHRQRPQHILALLKTAFIQRHLPKLERLFPNTECETTQQSVGDETTQQSVKPPSRVFRWPWSRTPTESEEHKATPRTTEQSDEHRAQCKINARVQCPGSSTMCAGDQCCPPPAGKTGSITCPSASTLHTRGCTHAKVVDCTT